ncbi:ABC transporter permease [Candidatus Aerophobetes bacterium]|nr:ABC transporter permease [Candidatus Aerophobetes bacterium]
MKLSNFKSILLVGIILTIWAIITLLTDLIQPIFIPSPINIWQSFLEMRDNLPMAILVSLGITLSGFGIGLVAGVGLGLAIAYSKNFMEMVGPLLDFTRPIPVLALIPLFLLWFGIGLLPQVLLVALGVSVVLGVETYEAVRNMPLVYIRAASNLGADKKTIFKTVVIPYIFPYLIGAIRVAAALSWGLDVASEFMGAQVGLGYNMIVQQIYLNTAGIIAIVIIYSLLAISFDQIIRKIESRVTRWTERSKISFEKI